MVDGRGQRQQEKIHGLADHGSEGGRGGMLTSSIAVTELIPKVVCQK